MAIGGVEVLDSDAAVVGGGVVHREVLVEAAPDASLGKIPALTHRPRLQWWRRRRACGRRAGCRCWSYRAIRDGKAIRESSTWHGNILHTQLGGRDRKFRDTPGQISSHPGFVIAHLRVSSNREKGSCSSGARHDDDRTCALG